MGIRMNTSAENIHRDLMASGEVTFRILRNSGTVLAEIVVEGNAGGHKFEMVATVNHRNDVKCIGKATLFREGSEPVTTEALMACFGTAYARAVDPYVKSNHQPVNDEEVARFVAAVRRGSVGLVSAFLHRATGGQFRLGFFDGEAREIIGNNDRITRDKLVSELLDALERDTPYQGKRALTALTGETHQSQIDRLWERFVILGRRNSLVETLHGEDTISVGDYVEVNTAQGGERGIVIDELVSKRNGVVGLVVQTVESVLQTPLEQVKLVAKCN